MVVRNRFKRRHQAENVMFLCKNEDIRASVSGFTIYIDGLYSIDIYLFSSGCFVRSYFNVANNLYDM